MRLDDADIKKLRELSECLRASSARHGEQRRDSAALRAAAERGERSARACTTRHTSQSAKPAQEGGDGIRR